MELKLMPREGWVCPTCGTVWAPWFPGPCRHPNLGKALTREDAWRALGGEGPAPEHEEADGAVERGGVTADQPWHDKEWREGAIHRAWVELQVNLIGEQEGSESLGESFEMVLLRFGWDGMLERVLDAALKED